MTIFSMLVPGFLWMTIIPIVMKYRILPVKETPYWLFAVLFILLICFTLFSLHSKEILRKIRNSKFEIRNNAFALWIKITLFTFIVFIGVISPLVTAIVDRHRVAPVYGVHDVLLQQEEAIKYLRVGKNPYKETYFGTFMEEFSYSEEGRNAVNPALYHFIMPPTYILIPFSLAPIVTRMFGYFDGRMLYVLFLAALSYIFYVWFERKEIAMITFILLFTGNMMFDHIMEGRSDLFAFFFLIVSLYLLDRKYIFLSSIMFGLGIMTKQTIWFAVPFYIAFIYFQANKSIIKTMKYLSISLGIAIVIILPFFLWDTSAFIKSVILFPGGGTTPNYPISGYGFGMILKSLGVIKDIHDYFPFMVLQGIIGIPVMIMSLQYMRRNPTIDRVFLGYAVTLFAVWYMSRYFNNNHILFIGQLFVFGLMKKIDKDSFLISNRSNF